MKKEVRTILQNQPVWFNETEVQLVLPAKHVGSVGPFILLDHISSWKQSRNTTANNTPVKFPAPHRGVITVAYILKGQIEHSDSRGNHASLEAGCMQWLNAGSGIVCDQDIKPALKQGETEISVIRAWINLPVNQKSQTPEYLSFCHDEIPHVTLHENAGWIRILCGSYDKVQAGIPAFSKQFLYHIHIEAARTFSMITEKDQEYAAFLPTHDAVINELQCQSSECVLFGLSGDFIEIQSDSDLSTDIILFGGAALKEPFVREEGFVMNSPHEITQAYNDFYDGRYGHINYNINNKTD